MLTEIGSRLRAALVLSVAALVVWGAYTVIDRSSETVTIIAAWLPKRMPRNTVTVLWWVGETHGSAQPVYSSLEKTFAYRRPGKVRVYVTTTDPTTIWTKCQITGAVSDDNEVPGRRPGTTTCQAGG